jgi:protein BUR2
MPALMIPTQIPMAGTPSDETKRRQEAQWLFTQEELDNPPSVRDGMALEDERERRGKGVTFIQQVGMMVKLPQMTISTAAVFMHRFMMRHSLKARDNRKAFHHYVRCFGDSANALFGL